LLCCSGSLEGGGSERQLWQLATQLDRGKVAAELYLHYRRGKYLDLLPPDLPVHAFWASRQSVGLHFPGRIHAAQIRHLRHVLKERQIDVVYDRTFHMTLVTAPACRASGCPRVSVIVSPPSQDFSRSRERFAWIKKWLLRRAYADPRSRTLAVSQSVAEDACRFYGLKTSTIDVVHSPVDVPAIIQAARANASLAASTARVCVVGRMSPEKGHARAIHAFAMARRLLYDDNMVLDLVGDGPQRPALESLTRQQGLEAHVHFHGFQDNPYPWIAGADLLLVPSDYEGLPNVALEAMSLRTPILATECSESLSHLLGNGSRGQLVSLTDHQAMARAIVRRFQHPEIWLSRLEPAYQHVLQYHAVEPWLGKMEQILTDMAKRGSQVAHA
jgi:glycosyltransferase involved in cell wall biosynthesis